MEKIWVREFRGFEELEILGCDVHVGKLLQELIDEENASTDYAKTMTYRIG